MLMVLVCISLRVKFLPPLFHVPCKRYAVTVPSKGVARGGPSPQSKCFRFLGWILAEIPVSLKYKLY